MNPGGLPAEVAPDVRGNLSPHTLHRLAIDPKAAERQRSWLHTSGPLGVIIRAW